jgi:DNA-binding transcriptional ArsR family regulator
MPCKTCEAIAAPDLADKTWFVHRSRILAALANPARLKMIVSLAQGEKCVCEMAQEVGLDMSTTSRHLAQLRQVGLLEDDRRGNMVFYQLKAKCIPDFLQCLDGLSER